jgi:hypothetical protein
MSEQFRTIHYPELIHEEKQQETGEPLVSFCIPTYNRPENLRKSLEAYEKAIMEAGRANLIEICISDNNYDRETEKVAEKFKGRLPLKYQRNGANIGYDRNFIKAMGMGTGKYLHMASDEDIITGDSLNRLLCILDTNPGSALDISRWKGIGILNELFLFGEQESPAFARNYIFSYDGTKQAFLLPATFMYIKRRHFQAAKEKVAKNFLYMDSLMCHVPIYLWCFAASKRISLIHEEIAKKGENQSHISDLNPKRVSTHAMLIAKYMKVTEECHKDGLISDDTYATFQDVLFWNIMEKSAIFRAKTLTKDGIERAWTREELTKAASPCKGIRGNILKVWLTMLMF